MSISKKDFDAAPYAEDGMKAVAADCRVCDAEVFVLADWTSSGVDIRSTGMRPRCRHSKCGEKMPCAAKRMATCDEIAIRTIQFMFDRSLCHGVSYSTIAEALFESNTTEDFDAAMKATFQLADLMECEK